MSDKIDDVLAKLLVSTEAPSAWAIRNALAKAGFKIVKADAVEAERDRCKKIVRDSRAVTKKLYPVGELRGVALAVTDGIEIEIAG